MTGGAVSTDTDFPVSWRFPDDPRWLWCHDRLHYPDQVTPLEFSLIELGVDAGLTKAARAYDVPITVHDRHVNSYLYLAVEPRVLPAGEAAALAERSAGRLHDAMAGLRPTWDTCWLPEIQEHLAWWAAFDLANATLAALRRHLAETLRRWQRLWEIHFLLLVPSMYAMSEFADLYVDLFEDAEPFDPYELLAGFDSKTLESSRQLWTLSRRILATPSVLDVFRSRRATDVVSHLEDSDAGRRFLAELDGYLEVHGHRADKLSLRHSYWVEDPSPVLHSLKAYVEDGDRDLGREMERTAQRREERESHLHERLREYPQRIREQVDFMLGAAQAGAFLAEEHGYWIDYGASYRVRQVLLTVGGRLEAAGVLADRDDVFYLQLDELEAVLDDHGTEDPRRDGTGDARRNGTGDARRDGAEYGARIAVRKEQAERFAHVVPPPLLGMLPAGGAAEDAGDPISRMFRKIEGDSPDSTAGDLAAGDPAAGDLAAGDRAAGDPAAGAALIVGNAGSPGVVQGTVRVVHVLGEAGKLRPGDILVAETTAPPWTPLFATAGGLVTDSGGILSHSAVVAREYGIPAVVGAGVATQRLHDGQLVEVDGNRGIVRVLE